MFTFDIDDLARFIIIVVIVKIGKIGRTTRLVLKEVQKPKSKSDESKQEGARFGELVARKEKWQKEGLTGVIHAADA